MRIALGIFIILHALVYGMYVGHALRWFEMKPGMSWPDGSWALGSLSDAAVRLFASVAIGACSLALIASSVGYMAGAGWGMWGVIGSSALVSVVHALLWSGKLSDFADNGGIGVAINVALAAVLLATR